MSREDIRTGEALTVSQLGDRVRAARELRGVSLRGLAKAVGYEFSAVSHIEKGRREPSVTKLVAIANALNVSADYLLGVGNLDSGGDKP